jgi:hypothetical protein
MSHIDCEDLHSTLQCLSDIYAVDQNELTQFFRSIDLELHYRTRNPSLSSEDELQRLLEERVGPPSNPPSRAYWFHLTRVLPGTSFADGILPLDQALPRVWSLLEHLFAGTPQEVRIKTLRQSGVPDRQYNLKTTDSLHWGPYAMLVKEIAFCADTASNHDYLKTPEIIEDICSGYAKRFGEEIQSEVENKLVPTIVKFWSEDVYGLASCIRYAYAAIHHEELGHTSNTCFDGAGCTVPPSQIVYVQQVP